MMRAVCAEPLMLRTTHTTIYATTHDPNRDFRRTQTRTSSTFLRLARISHNNNDLNPYVNTKHHNTQMMKSARRARGTNLSISQMLATRDVVDLSTLNAENETKRERCLYFWFGKCAHMNFFWKIRQFLITDNIKNIKMTFHVCVAFYIRRLTILTIYTHSTVQPSSHSKNGPNVAK